MSDSDPAQIRRGEECGEVMVVITAQTPVETCTVNTKPRQDCRQLTILTVMSPCRCKKEVELVPHLEAVEECVAVPREVCRQVRTRARQGGRARPRTRRRCSPPSVLLSVLP